MKNLAFLQNIHTKLLLYAGSLQLSEFQENIQDILEKEVKAFQ